MPIRNVMQLLAVAVATTKPAPAHAPQALNPSLMMAQGPTPEKPVAVLVQSLLLVALPVLVAKLVGLAKLVKP